jgi:hypothetical protein
MRRRRVVLVAVPSLLLISVLLATPSHGKKNLVYVDCTTTVTITPISETSATYSGKITCRPSPKGEGKKERARRRNAASRCPDDRTVEVWHGPVSEGFLIGKVTSNDDGSWSLTGNRAPSGDTVESFFTDIPPRGNASCGGDKQATKAP